MTARTTTLRLRSVSVRHELGVPTKSAALSVARIAQHHGWTDATMVVSRCGCLHLYRTEELADAAIALADAAAAMAEQPAMRVH